MNECVSQGSARISLSFGYNDCEKLSLPEKKTSERKNMWWIPFYDDVIQAFFLFIDKIAKKQFKKPNLRRI